MQRMRTAQRPATDGSRTITIEDSATRELHPANPDATESIEDGNDDGPNRTGQPTLVLNLQGGGNDVRRKRKAGQRVVWKEDVIDNEGAGKKKSKICCIYHKPRRFDESSDESSGESDCQGHNHSHGHGSNGPDTAEASSSGGVMASTTTETVVISNHHSDLNAYDAQPHHRPAPPN